MNQSISANKIGKNLRAVDTNIMVSKYRKVTSVINSYQVGRFFVEVLGIEKRPGDYVKMDQTQMADNQTTNQDESGKI